MWKDSIRNIVVIFQTTILRLVGFYVRRSAHVTNENSSFSCSNFPKSLYAICQQNTYSLFSNKIYGKYKHRFSSVCHSFYYALNISDTCSRHFKKCLNSCFPYMACQFSGQVNAARIVNQVMVFQAVQTKSISH